MELLPTQLILLYEQEEIALVVFRSEYWICMYM